MREISVDSSLRCFSTAAFPFSPDFNAYSVGQGLLIDPVIQHLDELYISLKPTAVLFTRLDCWTLASLHWLSQRSFPGRVFVPKPFLNSLKAQLPAKLQLFGLVEGMAMNVSSLRFTVTTSPVPDFSPGLMLHDDDRQFLISSYLFSSWQHTDPDLAARWPDTGFSLFEEFVSGPWPWAELEKMPSFLADTRFVLPCAGSIIALKHDTLPGDLKQSANLRLQTYSEGNTTWKTILQTFKDRLLTLCPADTVQAFFRSIPQDEPADVDRAWTAFFQALTEHFPPEVLPYLYPPTRKLTQQLNLALPAVYKKPSVRGSFFLMQENKANLLGIAHRCLDDTQFDSVTGLENEGSFKKKCRNHLEHNAANGGIILILPDNLRRVNNRYGRTGGDEALNAITYILTNLVRPQQASMYKLNGPYFALFAPNSDKEALLQLGNKLREEVAHSEAFYESLTISLGLVTFHDLPQDEEPDTLLDQLVKTGLGRVALAVKAGGNTLCDTSTQKEILSLAAPKILLIEPDTAYGRFLAEYLNTRGYMAILVHQGEEALEAIKREEPQVIICEAMVPQYSGFRLREELRKDSFLGRIPFILLSHRKTDDFILKAQQQSILWYFQKPIPLIELGGLIGLLIQREAL